MTGCRFIALTLIAVFSGCFGLFVLGGRGTDAVFFIWVAGASSAIWLSFGSLYRHWKWAWVHAVYLGALSPFIGALLVAPPWSFPVVAAKPGFSISLGIITSLTVCLVARGGWRREEAEF